MNGRDDQPELHRLARRADVYIAIVSFKPETRPISAIRKAGEAST